MIVTSTIEDDNDNDEDEDDEDGQQFVESDQQSDMYQQNQNITHYVDTTLKSKGAQNYPTYTNTSSNKTVNQRISALSDISSVQKHGALGNFHVQQPAHLESKRYCNTTDDEELDE